LPGKQISFGRQRFPNAPDPYLCLADDLVRTRTGAGIADALDGTGCNTKRMLYQVGPVVERRPAREERSSDPKAVHLCMVLQPGVSGSWREFLHETFSLKRIPTIDADTPIDLADA